MTTNYLNSALNVYLFFDDKDVKGFGSIHHLILTFFKKYFFLLNAAAKIFFSVKKMLLNL